MSTVDKLIVVLALFTFALVFFALGGEVATRSWFWMWLWVSSLCLNTSVLVLYFARAAREARGKIE